ncbi:hypothetical protein [Deinococcus sp.]|uniref:hypothetical protein n=1 Tax=Deinococcus sp. TaxID=47478 RepID=UPI0025C0732E|nr:hypothetical protein [Deinococcus sp.]
MQKDGAVLTIFLPSGTSEQERAGRRIKGAAVCFRRAHHFGVVGWNYSRQSLPKVLENAFFSIGFPKQKVPILPFTKFSASSLESRPFRQKHNPVPDGTHDWASWNYD